MERLFITKGEKIIYNDTKCVIIRIINVNTVSIEEIETHIIYTVDVSELEPIEKNQELEYNLHGLSEKEWEKANMRYNVIKPILKNRGDLDLIHKTALKNKVGVSTIYRWLKLFDNSGLVSSLVGMKRTGGIGKSRLSNLQEDVINDKIHAVYLNSSRKSIIKTIREIQLVCDEFSIPCPHPNTVRNRIKNISEEEKIRKRFGIQEARYKYEPLKGKFPSADYPLSVVQIDHTPVDIILVDAYYRKPIKRPWLTLAIDVYSRMVVGFYLSFETPGFLGTGMCIANSILPKEMWLEQMEIDAEWPCWGIMDKIHVDNAKEFRSNMLKKSCINYGIDIEFRPVATPHYGGHIERLLGTFAKEIHNLPGTTFSSSEERKKYNSSKNASFTLQEFERWLTIFITKIYHTRIHTEINQSPLERFKNGIMGNKEMPGKGIPPRINNEKKVRLDFMPFVERTIQEYGIVIDHIYYYSDALRSYIHDSEKNIKKQHIFKRDPRDISIVYFYDPNIDDYIEIPYRDASLPPMSIWEHREILKKLKENRVNIDEKSIFSAFRELNELEERSIRETRNRKRNKILNQQELKLKSPDENEEQERVTNIEDIKPFEEIDDEAFNRKN
ncbi:MAG: DDE-type integrase/transposase/recombinase [Bacteroidales bacterium]|jgi:putative transposase|nr:DDE-type integrase/transposase/recombinase [Bacteroidales bacterium]